MTRVAPMIALLAGCAGAAPEETVAPEPSAATFDVEEPWSVPPEYAPRPISAEAGEAYFGTYGVGDPYGAGVPYPVLRGLMALYPDELGADFAELSARFGFIPSPDAPDDPDALPVGFYRTRDPITGVDFVVANCQICHAARIRTADGERVVTGLGNRRVRIHDYAAAFARIAADDVSDSRVEHAATEAAARLDAEWPPRYRGPLTRAVLRELRRRFEARGDDVERLAGGLPGRVATLEGFMIAMNTYLGTDLHLPETIGWARIPDVRPWRHRETNSFDGAAIGAPVALVAEADFAFGVRPRWYEENRHIATSIFLYLRSFDRDLPFPGETDQPLASAGYDAFEEACASCHGHYARPGEARRIGYVERIVPVDVVGTDRARLDSVTDELVAAAERVESTAGLVLTRQTGGYVPRPLVDVWARGQYGHAGQWPDLAFLATPPRERPRRFIVSPDAPYDLERIGQRWRVAEGPAREGEYLYDGTEPGYDVGGHPFLSDLPDEDRRAVLEYLKTL